MVAYLAPAANRVLGVRESGQGQGGVGEALGLGFALDQGQEAVGKCLGRVAHDGCDKRTGSENRGACARRATWTSPVKTHQAARWVMAEVILGYIMLGGLISIFANKLARRGG